MASLMAGTRNANDPVLWRATEFYISICSQLPSTLNMLPSCRVVLKTVILSNVS